MKKIKYILPFIQVAVLFFPMAMAMAAAESDAGSSGGKITNPLKGNDNLITFFNTILDKIIIPLGALAAFIFLVYSGFLFVTAQGDPGKIKTAKSNITYVVIGAAIILGAKVLAAGIQGTLEALK